MKNDESFFVAQKAFIEKGGKILVLNDPVEGLDFPGGKIQTDEYDTSKSLEREVAEETSIKIEVGAPFTTWIEVFKHDDFAGKKVLLIGYKCRFLSGEIKLSDEHNHYLWVDKENYSEVKEDSSFFAALEEYFE